MHPFFFAILSFDFALQAEKMNRGNFNQQGGGGNGGSVPPPGFGNYLQSTGNQFGYSNFQQLIRMPSPANDTANVPHILPVFPTSYTPAPIVAPNFSNHPFNQNQRLPINGPMHGHFIQVPEIPATGHFNRYQSQGQQLPVGNQPQPEVTRSEPGVWVHPVVDATVSYGSGFQVEPHASEIGFSAENAPRMERSTRSIPPGFGYTVDGRTLPFAIPRTLAAPIPVRQSSGRNQTRAPSSSAGSSAHCQRVSDSEEEDEESQLGASGKKNIFKNMLVANPNGKSCIINTVCLTKCYLL